MIYNGFSFGGISRTRTYDPHDVNGTVVLARIIFLELMTSGRLNTYLADINEKATEQMLLLVKQMAEREGVTEELKAQDQMLWVQRMNNIRDRATELVNHELIYV